MIEWQEKTRFFKGLSGISDSYTGFIIDQLGVLHDGKKAFDGVVPCLKELKTRKKMVVILSNSGRRAADTKEALKKTGVSPSLYSAIVTSGEMTWKGLSTQDEGFFEGLGRSCYLISRAGDTSLVDGLDIDVVDDIADAGFLLISGSDAPDKTLEDYEPVLKEAARRRIVALCANPDSVRVLGALNVMGPGTLARRYQDFGGVVHYIGKPHRPIYQECLKILQAKGVFPSETVVVGDSMSHDIIGGAAAGLDTCLIRNGLHRPAFSSVRCMQDLHKVLDNLASQYDNVHPTFIMETLKWGDPLPDRKHKKRAQARA